MDCNLYENLEVSFKQVSPRSSSTFVPHPRRRTPLTPPDPAQDYPNFEIIFSVAHETDQAIPIVQDLMTKYPTVAAQLIVGQSRLPFAGPQPLARHSFVR